MARGTPSRLAIQALVDICQKLVSTYIVSHMNGFDNHKSVMLYVFPLERLEDYILYYSTKGSYYTNHETENL